MNRKQAEKLLAGPTLDAIMESSPAALRDRLVKASEAVVEHTRAMAKDAKLADAKAVAKELSDVYKVPIRELRAIETVVVERLRELGE